MLRGLIFWWHLSCIMWSFARLSVLVLIRVLIKTLLKVIDRVYLANGFGVCLNVDYCNCFSRFLDWSTIYIWLASSNKWSSGIDGVVLAFQALSIHFFRFYSNGKSRGLGFVEHSSHCRIFLKGLNSWHLLFSWK